MEEVNHTLHDLNLGAEENDEESTRIDPLSILPLDDVLCLHIFPLTSVSTLFTCRRINTKWKSAVEYYFSRNTSLLLANVASKCHPEAFNILTGNSFLLRSLSLRNSKHWLTDNLLVPVFQNNSHLEYVDLSNCINLTDKVLHVLAVNCPNLNELYLRECVGIQQTGLQQVALHCNKLQRLDLTGCWEVTDEAVCMVAKYCTQLKMLSISKIYRLTDSSLKFLADFCPKLQMLYMKGCWRVSDDGIRKLGEYCKELRVLQVKECRDVTEASLARLRARGVVIDVNKPMYRHGGRYPVSLRLDEVRMFPSKRGTWIPPSLEAMAKIISLP